MATPQNDESEDSLPGELLALAKHYDANGDHRLSKKELAAFAQVALEESGFTAADLNAIVQEKPVSAFMAQLATATPEQAPVIFQAMAENFQPRILANGLIASSIRSVQTMALRFQATATNDTALAELMDKDDMPASAEAMAQLRAELRELKTYQLDHLAIPRVEDVYPHLTPTPPQLKSDRRHRPLD